MWLMDLSVILVVTGVEVAAFSGWGYRPPFHRGISHHCGSLSAARLRDHKNTKTGFHISYG